MFNGANMRGADLRGANLAGADLDRAILSDANFSGADLTGANLARTSMIGTNLTGANLTGANFAGADMVRSNLADANLDDADLFQTRIWGCNLSGTNFAGAGLGYAVFQDCDLRSAVGLDQVRHDAPSSVGVDTIYRSGGLVPGAFLAGAGVPESVAVLQETIAAAPPALSEYYIACRDDDEEFARKLSGDLSALGVNAWVFSQHVRGSALVSRLSSSDQEEVERWIRNYDRLIVVASSRALDTEAILNDITAAREKQQSTDRWLLYLVAPDNGLMRPGGRAARNMAAENVIFDLRPEDDGVYQAELTKLADALRQEQPASAGVPVGRFPVVDLAGQPAGISSSPKGRGQIPLPSFSFPYRGRFSRLQPRIPRAGESPLVLALPSCSSVSRTRAGESPWSWLCRVAPSVSRTRLARHPARLPRQCASLGLRLRWSVRTAPPGRTGAAHPAHSRGQDPARPL